MGRSSAMIIRDINCTHLSIFENDLQIIHTPTRYTPTRCISLHVQRRLQVRRRIPMPPFPPLIVIINEELVL